MRCRSAAPLGTRGHPRHRACAGDRRVAISRIPRSRRQGVVLSVAPAHDAAAALHAPRLRPKNLHCFINISSFWFASTVQPESLRKVSLLRRGAGSNGREQGFVLGLILLGGFECGLAFVVAEIGIGSMAKK